MFCRPQMFVCVMVCLMVLVSAGDYRNRHVGARSQRRHHQQLISDLFRADDDGWWGHRRPLESRRETPVESRGESPNERKPGKWNPFKHIRSYLDQDLMSPFPDYFSTPTREQRSWWQGPNICEKRINDAVNTTDSENPVMFHYSTRSMSCDNSESAYKCVIEESDNGRKLKTTVIYQCCHGYTRKERDFGCPQRLQLKNLVDTAIDLELTEFLEAVDMLKLTEKIKYGNFTVFAPVNGAFGLDGDFISTPENSLILKDAPAAFQVSEPGLEKTLETLQGAILGHMLAGSHRSSSLNDEHVIETGHPELSTIRINYFQRPDKLMTANCVPIISRDNMATNGVIHTVEKALKPVTESLLDLVRARPELSIFKTVLGAASYVPILEEDGKFTLLAPTNNAFEKINPRLRQRLFSGDKKCIESVLLNHILPHVICSSAFQEKTHTINKLGNKVNVIRTEEGKLFTNGAQVVDKDLMGLNGVMHIIDSVLIPEEALGIVDVLEHRGFTELVSLVGRAGLTDTLNSAKNVTLFAPTNKAIESLPLALRSKLGSDKDFLKKVLIYHVSTTEVETRHFRNEKLISTLEGRQIRLNRYTSNPFVEPVRTSQCAVIEGKSTKTCNGKLNVLSSVMIPPQGNVIDVLAEDKRFSTLVKFLKKADLVHTLQQAGPFTILAPNNKAFERLDEETVRNLLRRPQELATLLKSHVYQKNLCCAGILRKSWFSGQSIRTLSGTYRKVTKNRQGKATVSMVPIVKCDRTASNGNVLEIDQVLTSQPKPSWRNRWNRNDRNNLRHWFFHI